MSNACSAVKFDSLPWYYRDRRQRIRRLPKKSGDNCLLAALVGRRHAWPLLRCASASFPSVLKRRIASRNYLESCQVQLTGCNGPASRPDPYHPEKPFTSFQNKSSPSQAVQSRGKAFSRKAILARFPASSYLPRKYILGYAPISLRRKAFEALAGSCLKTENCKSPRQARSVSWVTPFSSAGMA